MSEITQPERQALVEAARAAEPGPYVVAETLSRVDTPAGSISISWFSNELENPYETSERQAAFIALANPSAILSLEAALTAAEEDRDNMYHRATNAEARLFASEARAARLEEENTAMRATLDFVDDRLIEINPSNYDHDDACKLNDRSVEAILAVRSTLAELAALRPETTSTEGSYQ